MKALYSILLMLVLCKAALADTLVTRPQAAMMTLTKALEHYAEANDGQLPAKLSDLDPYLVSSLERQLGGGPLDESVMLINTREIEMITPNKNEVFTGGQILAVTASSIGEDRREENGRYVIWKTPKGEFRAAWLNESLVKAQFVKAMVNLPSGPFLQQPSTLEASPDYMMRKYAEENFKDPKAPTAEEIEKMKQDFAERYSDRPPNTPSPVASQAITTTPSTKPPASPSSTATAEAKQSPSSFSIVPLVILAAVIVGVVVFLFKRKRP